ncbi:MAG: primosomal protein N' [Acidobacteriota bacterium]|nr:primosomal protein N' [Acidobacteriota bacterium]
MPRFCDVSLPVPLDRAFSYSLPLTLQHRVKTGARVLVPFGLRKLVGVVLRVHDEETELPRDAPLKDALRLIDPEPVLDDELIALGKWISGYYCAPLGEVLRSMLPLASDIRTGKIYSLTDAGRDASRQMSIASDAADTVNEVVQMLAARSLAAAYIKKKIPLADRILKSLERRGWIVSEEVSRDRDPARAPSAKLRISLVGPEPAGKLPKAERELLAYLALHPGSHNLGELEALIRNAGQAARSLARRKAIALATEPIAIGSAALANARGRAPHELNRAQRNAFDLIAAGIDARKFCTFLLHGVTGSGKTEVYLNAIDTVLAAGRGALLLVPEIALTPAVAGQFYARFGDRVAILHSAFSDAERADQWRRIQVGGASVVVGTRSGAFAPVRNLGLIIVDEEHDASYKQEETPRYNGRDVAIVRAQAANACVVLGSATPSLESRFNATSGKYTLLEIPDRIADRPMPTVKVIDMREEFLETRKHAIFSRALIEAIRERLSNNEQAMILLNRRGFSSFVACRSCGERIECINCAVTLTYHRRDRRLLCHFCGYAEKVPSVCPKCQSEHVHFMGSGSERVEDELHNEFPEAKIARLDRDTVAGKRQFEDILQNFRERNFDILVGTQMIAKGHDIPNVTLVGVVSADVGIGMPDFRAAERTFQILTQVAGRAGRGHLPGMVYMQTINPDHYAIRFAAQQDYTGFFEKELQFRRFMKYPPFAAMANILVRAAKQEDALRMSTELGHHITPAPDNMRIMGPAEAPVPRLKAEFRYQLLIKSGSRKDLNALLKKAQQFGRDQKWGATALVIDVDPLTLL